MSDKSVVRYDMRIVNKAIELYNKRTSEGKRVYRVEAIPDILREEFPTDKKVKTLCRSSIYQWLNKFDTPNRARRESQNEQ